MSTILSNVFQNLDGFLEKWTLQKNPKKQKQQQQKPKNKTEKQKQNTNIYFSLPLTELVVNKKGHLKTLIYDKKY